MHEKHAEFSTTKSIPQYHGGLLINWKLLFTLDCGRRESLTLSRDGSYNNFDFTAISKHHVLFSILVVTMILLSIRDSVLSYDGCSESKNILHTNTIWLYHEALYPRRGRERQFARLVDPRMFNPTMSGQIRVLSLPDPAIR